MTNLKGSIAEVIFSLGLCRIGIALSLENAHFLHGELFIIRARGIG